MAWLNEIEKPQPSAVKELKRANSGKGWIVVTAEFDAFIWNSDKMLKQLLVAVSSWADTGEAKSLQVVPDNAEKRKFKIEPVVDKKKQVIPISCRRTDSGFSFGEQLEEEELNPFL